MAAKTANAVLISAKMRASDASRTSLPVALLSAEAATAQGTKREGEEKPATAARGGSAPTAGRKLSYKERQELQQLEARIEAAEERKGEIEARLASASGDYTVAQALAGELQALIAALERDMERWAELAEFA